MVRLLALHCGDCSNAGEEVHVNGLSVDDCLALKLVKAGIVNSTLSLIGRDNDGLVDPDLPCDEESDQLHDKGSVCRVVLGHGHRLHVLLAVFDIEVDVSPFHILGGDPGKCSQSLNKVSSKTDRSSLAFGDKETIVREPRRESDWLPTHAVAEEQLLRWVSRATQADEERVIEVTRELADLWSGILTQDKAFQLLPVATDEDATNLKIRFLVVVRRRSQCQGSLMPRR